MTIIRLSYQHAFRKIISNYVISNPNNKALSNSNFEELSNFNDCFQNINKIFFGIVFINPFLICKTPTLRIF